MHVRHAPGDGSENDDYVASDIRELFLAATNTKKADTVDPME